MGASLFKSQCIVYLVKGTAALWPVLVWRVTGVPCSFFCPVASYVAQRAMWFKVVLLALSLSLLGLGAAQECEGVVGVLGVTPDQLKKEI